MKSKIQYIDALKVFAIFVVVWGHLIFRFGKSPINELTHQFIYSFHMPLFAFLSGYFLSIKNGLWNSLKAKFVRLGIPLIFWSVLSGVIREFFLLCDRDIHAFAILRNILAHITLWDFWYLRALLLDFFIAIVVLKMSPIRRKVSLPLSIIVVMLLAFLGCIPEDNPYLDVKGFVFLYPFLCLGALYHDFELFLSRYEDLFFSFALLGFMISLIFWDVKYTFYYTHLSAYNDYSVFYVTLFRLFTGITGTMSFFMLFRKFRNSTLFSSKLINRVANSTLCIYIVHVLIVSNGFLPCWYGITGAYAFVFSIVMSFFVLSFCYLFYIGTSKKKVLRLIFWGELK